eukprot:m.331460 g.331460  ORF g.331460 m.331460 type:complete len:494 (+) comp16734_c0_seq1:78-1559(+)
MARSVAVVLAVLVACAAAEDMIWNGRASTLKDPRNWDGPYPFGDEIPAYVTFAGTAKLEAGSIAQVGAKFVLTPGAAIKFSSAGGKTSKLSLNSATAGSKPSKFIPGSDSAVDNKDFDLRCNMNWRTANGKIPALPPCSTGDTGYIMTTDQVGLTAPATINAGDPIFATSSANPLRMALNLEGSKANIGSCKASMVQEQSITVKLGGCSSSQFTPSTGCSTSCPPLADLGDFGFVQPIITQGSFPDAIYVHIDKNGVQHSYNVEVDDTNDMLTLELPTGTPLKFVKDTGIVYKVYSTTPEEVSTTTPDGAVNPSTAKVLTKANGDPIVTLPDGSPHPTNKDGSTIPTTAGGDGTVSGSKSGDDSNNNTLIIVIVIVVVILVVAVIAAVVIIKKKGSEPSDRSVVSFENPMYDDANAGRGGAPQQQSAGGYQDVGPASGGDDFYDDPEEAMGGGGGNTGYMDVAPQSGDTGYMDVNPTDNFNDDDFDEDEAEDV